MVSHKLQNYKKIDICIWLINTMSEIYILIF